jgi:hypothetical protein
MSFHVGSGTEESIHQCDVCANEWFPLVSLDIPLYFAIPREHGLDRKQYH